MGGKKSPHTELILGRKVITFRIAEVTVSDRPQRDALV